MADLKRTTGIDVGPRVTIGDAPLRIQDVVAVSRAALVELSTAAIDRIRRSRGMIEEKLRAKNRRITCFTDPSNTDGRTGVNTVTGGRM
jgi:hypothetical protein